jgi:hypothetical protein
MSRPIFSDRALAVDGFLADPRETHAMVEESEIPSWEDRPAVFQ